MSNKVVILERIKYKDEFVYVDLNDILDILDTNQTGHYSIIFYNGESWFSVKLTKAIINKFNKIKEKRGQK